MQRRTLLKLLAGGALASRYASVFAKSATSADFFIFIHAAGGWDVTLWADPRNERKGLVDPASSANTEFGTLTHFKAARLAGERTFEPLRPNSLMSLGPAIGDLLDLHDRMTIVNGISMNTVSHEDGIVVATTGRHRSGGTLPESSIDVVIANELGTDQVIPDISVKFPSAFVGSRLDRRAIPVRAGSVDAITKSFVRSSEYLESADRSEITAVLTEEAEQLASRSTHPVVFDQLASQQQSLAHLLGDDLAASFAEQALMTRYTNFNYKTRSQGLATTNAAFAVEALRRNLVRCVGFGLGGLDTHLQNYRYHATTLQDIFNVVAALVKTLDMTPHPTRTSAKLSEHTHILVVSEFARTPQINRFGGRDHYPNNSALIISPKFRGGRTFGATDQDQVLPRERDTLFTNGKRAISSADLLATYAGAFGIDPRAYMRDGEVMSELLR